MAITFSASSLAFGNVGLNQPAAQQLTVSNSGTSPVTVTLTPPTGYSVATSPVMVPASGGTPGTAIIQVTFTPTLAQSYPGTLSGTSSSGDSVPSCTLSGTGVAADTLTTAGTDPNLFESEHAPSVSADTGTKYYQVMVPNFALNGDVSAPGTSFLRIGNFNASPPSSSGSALTGEAKSWQLARMVGDSQAIQNAEPLHDLAPDANPTTPSYKGDPNYMLGFCDDTRFRNDESSNGWQDRLTETKKLLSMGGWWDHSDGNRISTTAGDKVEIIQGNYKMVVMGRQAPPAFPAVLASTALETQYWTPATQTALVRLFTAKPPPGSATTSPLTGADISGDTATFPSISSDNANAVAAKYGQQQAYASYVGGNVLITDISGGLMAENGPSPTHCIKSIEFSQTEGGTWEVYQNNGVGHVYSSFYGDTVDIFLGPHKATFTGQADDYTAQDTDDTEVYNVYQKSLAIRKQLGEHTSDVNPAILDHVWATKILDYKRVSGDINSNVKAANIWSHTKAGQIESDTIANTITSTQTAAAITSTNFALNNFALTFGIQESINIGAILEMQLAAKVSVGLTRTRVYGLNDSVDLSRNVVAAQEAKVTALRTAINEFVTEVTDLDNRIHANALTLSDVTIDLAVAVTILATETLLG